MIIFSFIIIDCPKYTGPAFFDDPEQRTWIPLQPHRVQDTRQSRIARYQFPFVLGWALTPWKAQGMTLDKVICKIGRAAASPGTQFHFVKISFREISFRENLIS